MKSGIHPDYKIVTVTCACGESFTTRSTKDDMRLEICAKCHPFFTGKQKLIDSAGRVERFEKRYKNASKEGPQVPAKPAAPVVARPAIHGSARSGAPRAGEKYVPGAGPPGGKGFAGAGGGRGFAGAGGGKTRTGAGGRGPAPAGGKGPAAAGGKGPAAAGGKGPAAAS